MRLEDDIVRSLTRLSWGQRRRKRLEFIPQSMHVGCGAACLTMVFRGLGVDVDLYQVEGAMAMGRSGATAKALILTAEKFGVRGRGIRCDLSELQDLRCPAILHWKFSHFVVLERVTRKQVLVLDPAVGPRAIGWREFSEAFTGIALEFDAPSGPQHLRENVVRGANLGDKMRRYRAQITRLIVISLLLRILGLLVPALTALLVDRVIPQGDLQLLVILAAAGGTAVAVQLLAEVIRTLTTLALRASIDVELSLELMNHLLSLPFRFFQRHSTGDLLVRVASTGTIREMFTSALTSALLDGPLALLYLVVLATIAPEIAAVACVFGGLQILLLLALRRRYYTTNASLLLAQSYTDTVLADALTGIESLKAASAEGQVLRRWVDLFVEEVNASVVKGQTSMWLESGANFLQQLAPVVVLTVGAALNLRGDLSLGELLAAVALASAFLGPLSSLLDGAMRLQEMGAYLDRIEDIFRHEPERSLDDNFSGELTGAISVRNVDFSYDPEGAMTIRGVSFEVSPGMRCAIVGRSGSGKSTLARLMAGLLVPDRGSIRYDGYEVGSPGSKGIRAKLGFVVQNGALFSGTIEDNISLMVEDASSEEIIQAAKAACIHDDIIRMPLGYKTRLSPGGSDLSGGQRQRIALARAFLARPKVLIMDEGTSALDTATEASIVEHLQLVGATQVILAHRLSTIIGADLVLVMDEGEIKERGTHAELVRRGGIYAQLVAKQVVLG